ncbi:MAG: 4-alpha-glucanotransferase, partial [Oscillospiraceae bacterium]|nr:4-alpha-glucanotransferase [Oscillospiraceae bacterium]
QLWGNPLYRWDYHRETGYDWWLTRLWYVYQLYDVTRIDHFRGFDEYYSIPYGHKTAEFGHWEKGPGIELFRRAEEVLGWHEVIAEDLGFVTDSVRQLVRDSGFPGMKVLQFAFDSRDTGSARDYLPHNYTENAVVYTGTHDNDTTIGWFEAVSDDDWNLAREYLCDFYTPDEEMDQPFVALAMQSVARMCIIPMQDHLGLGAEARMNTPSTIGCNWRWRMTDDQFTQELCRDILDQTRRYGRTDK